jgi:hypothetical protein
LPKAIANAVLGWLDCNSLADNFAEEDRIKAVSISRLIGCGEEDGASIVGADVGAEKTRSSSDKMVKVDVDSPVMELMAFCSSPVDIPNSNPFAIDCCRLVALSPGASKTSEEP